MNTIEKAAAFALHELLELQAGQLLLLAGEPRTAPISQTFRKVAAKARIDTIFMEWPDRAKSNGSLSSAFRKLLATFDAALVIRSTVDVEMMNYLRAQSHTRVALIIGADEDSLRRCLEANHKRLAERCRKLADILTIGRSLKIVGDNGTELKVSVGQMKGTAETAPLNGACSCGSLPTGRAFITPAVSSAEGMIVLQTIAGQRGGSGQAIELKIRDGKIAQVKGGRAAQVFRQFLRLGGNTARLLVEIGFGLNEKARLGHSALEDEKVLGTAHLGFGDLSGPGKSPAVFVRGIIQTLSLTIDGQKIIHHGQFSFA